LSPPIGLQIVESVPQVGGLEVGVVEGVVGAAVVDGVVGVAGAAVVASACATFAVEKIDGANGVIKIAAANKIGVASKHADRKYFFIIMLMLLK
jgi:hypothetical protein